MKQQFSDTGHQAARVVSVPPKWENPHIHTKQSLWLLQLTVRSKHPNLNSQSCLCACEWVGWLVWICWSKMESRCESPESPKAFSWFLPAGSAFLLKVFNTLHPHTYAHTVPFPRPRPLDLGWHLSLPLKISREAGVAGWTSSKYSLTYGWWWELRERPTAKGKHHALGWAASGSRHPSHIGIATKIH